MFDSFVSHGEAILALAALLTGLGVLLRKAWRFLRKGVKLTDKLLGSDDTPGLFDQLDTLQTNQVRIIHELFPNGGASLRDAVDRVRDEVTGLRALAEQAKESAAEAVDEAAALQAALGRADHAGRVERERAQATLDRVMDAFLDDRREQEHKTRAYVRALQDLGIDLTPVVEELEEHPWDGPSH